MAREAHISLDIARTPQELSTFLNRLIGYNIMDPVMIWGKAGIGKSSVVAEIGRKNKLPVIDLRLSHFSPQDLRGLPRIDIESNTARWCAPSCLPNDPESNGILFLDELNMAPPAVMNAAQQLIHDRKLGEYVLPEGWFIFAAGNRKEDRASVFEMPSPVANRFLHIEVTEHLESFKQYAFSKGLHEDVIGFLSFRPTLLHQQDFQRPAWPSPRSWEKASKLHSIGLSIDVAIGTGGASEFEAYTAIKSKLVNLESVISGRFETASFPIEPSLIWATIVGLVTRCEEAKHVINASRWILNNGSNEWMATFIADAINRFMSSGRVGILALAMKEEPSIQQFVKDYHELLAMN
jgi:MoxR-like ATPase